MDNEIAVKSLMVQLLKLIDGLNQLLDSDETMRFVGYETSPVQAQDQSEVLAHGKQSIEVTTLDQWHHRWTVLDYFKRFYAPDNASTRYVSRMPGLIVTAVPGPTVIDWVNQINDKKDQIASLVRSGRSPYLKHKFIHDAFPQIMTEQLYRHIKVVDSPVKSVWFKWVHRHVPITLKPDAAISWLLEQKNKTRSGYLDEEWQSMTAAVISEIEQGNYHKLQRRRTYKSFPVCDYSYYDSQGKRKVSSFNATLPLILLNQPGNQLPRHSALQTFIKSRQPMPEDKLPHNTKMLFRALNLIGYNT